MRRCPVCQRTYPNDAQNFCLEDGTTLVSDGAVNPYDQRTAPTEMMYPPRPTAPPVPPPAPPAAAFGAYAEKKKSPLPWILGGVGLLVVGIIVTVVAMSSSTSKSDSGSKVDVNVNSGSSTPYPSSTPAWQDFNGDKFSVSMPGSPTKTENKQETAAGTVPVVMYTLDKGLEGFVVGYTEYPTWAFDAMDPEKIFDGARDGGVGNVNGQVLSERTISSGSYAGREVTGKAPTQGFGFTMRLYLAKPRMYMLIFLKKGDEPISDDGKKFLESFEIKSS